MSDPTDVLNLEFKDQRRTNTHPTGGRRMTLAGATFDARLPYELVLSVDDADSVFAKYGVPAEKALELMKHPVFVKALKSAEAELKEGGITFRTKARLMAEDLLEEGYQIATDPEAPANVRASLIQWVAKMGDLEPAKKEAAGGGFGNFTLQIDLGGGDSEKGRSISVKANAPAPAPEAIDLVPGVDGVLVPASGGEYDNGLADSGEPGEEDA